MIILVGGQKGGTGKTTLTVNLAAQSNDISQTIIIDTDPQATASDWCYIRQKSHQDKYITSIQKFGDGLRKDALTISKKYDKCFIDTNGVESKELRTALVISDIALFPIQASQFDLWTIQVLNDLVADAKCLNPKLKAYVVMTRVHTNPVVNEATAARDYIKDFEHLTLLDSFISDRIDYRKSIKVGLSVTEEQFNKTKSSKEVHNLNKELFNEHI
jgi:chromosome partitioning protein